ncbi:MAG: winged helix DNA-binding domain-containing protein [Anaerolineales bacterium]
MPVSLKWRQVHAWRVSQHHLSTRLKRKDFVKAATRVVGVQSQVLSAAELALSARVDGLSRSDVQSALWQAHTLVKTWAMRGTLHLISASQLPLVTAARAMDGDRGWSNYFSYYGVNSKQQAAFLAAVPEVLSDVPMTREQLASAVARETRAPALYELIVTSGWGSPLKPSAFRGDLCFGPSQGQNVTFVNPKKWVRAWQTIDPMQALQEILRLYLQAYGPTTVEHFSRWWWGGGGILSARKIFQSLKDELEEVDVEGWRALALRSTLDSIQKQEVSNTVYLLPLFDIYVLGLGRDLEPLLPAIHKRRVFRPQGWITAVVLVNGSIKGVWEYKTRNTQTVLKIRMFSKPTALIRKGIEAEAERLAAFFKTNISLEYETS